MNYSVIMFKGDAMKYSLKLFLMFVRLPKIIRNIKTELSTQKFRNEQLTHKLIRLETIIELQLTKKSCKK